MSWTSPFRLKLAARHLHEGKILAYPTEAVWGLGCDPLNREAVRALLALKGRSAAKGLILIAADFNQIEPFLKIGTEAIKDRMLANWPGPVTWVVPASPATPLWLQIREHTLAVRVTAHPLASSLCRTYGGPIVSTSANPSGATPARTIHKTRAYFKGAPLSFLPGSCGGLDKPTAIFDARSGNRLR